MSTHTIAPCILVGDTAEQIQSLPAANLIARFKKGIENFDRRIFWLSESQLDHAFLPDAGVGTWPIRVLLGHLADAEMVFCHRFRRVVAEDHPVLALWDENAFIDANIYAPALVKPDSEPSQHMSAVGAYLAVIHTLRMWTAEWLASLPPDTWSRTALHPERGEITLAQMVAYDTWHVEHHARFLKAKLDRMFGPGLTPNAAEAAAVSAGTCGSGCGCSTPKK